MRWRRSRRSRPRDVLASPIARTLVEQTPTKVLFPNLEAQRAEYVDGFGLSEREFELIGRELTPGSRRFLVRQGMQGVVCELNLRGFEHELAVISGRTENVQRMERLIAECGVEPGGLVAGVSGRGGEQRSRGRSGGPEEMDRAVTWCAGARRGRGSMDVEPKWPGDAVACAIARAVTRTAPGEEGCPVWVGAAEEGAKHEREATERRRAVATAVAA